MSEDGRRRRSKWDNKDPEGLPEDYYDRAPSRRPREPISPGRGSRRHDSRSRESEMTLDREGNCTRISPELDDWRPRNSSRSPRNGWSRSHRISRSRSRSKSPAHNFRREYAVNDRSRNRSEASGQICRDFAAGRCRKGPSCHFLHQDSHDSRQPLERGPPDDWEGRRRRTANSRFSPDDIKDNVIRSEKSAHICNDFLKGRCRRGDACRFVHNTSADVFEKGPGEEVYRNRDNEHRGRDIRDRSRDTYPDHDHRSRDNYPDHDHGNRDRSGDAYPDRDHGNRDRSRDTYPDVDRRSRDSYSDHDHRRKDMYNDRTYDSEPHRRGEIPCKFFASGNCRNGTRCRFSHHVEEVASPERFRHDKRDTDRKFEGSRGWDGPSRGDATVVSAVSTVPRDSDHKFEGSRGWDGPSWDDATAVPAVSTVPHDSDRKFEGSRGWDGPSWDDATAVSAVPTVSGWGEDKSEKKDVITVKIQDDEGGLDHKNGGDLVCDGRSWNDSTSAPIASIVHGWGDDNNGIREVAEDMTGARPRDDSWSHDMLNKPTCNPPATSVDNSQVQEQVDTLQWQTESKTSTMGLSTPRGVDISSGEMEISPRYVKQQMIFNSSTLQTPSVSNIAFAGVQGMADDMLNKPTCNPPTTSVYNSQVQEQVDTLQRQTESNTSTMGLSTPRGVDISSGEMEISPRYVKQQMIFNSSTLQTPSVSNIAFAGVQGMADETSSFEKLYHTELLSEQNPSVRDDKPISYSEERGDMVGDHNGSSIIQNQAITVPQGQAIFQADINANVHPVPIITPPVQSQVPVLLHAPQGQGMQEVLHKPASSENNVSAGPHTFGLSSSAPAPGSAHSTVSNVQLAQLSHLSASLTQLFESTQQRSQLSSSVSPHGLPNLLDLAAPAPPVSGATVPPNQAPEVLKQYDSASNSIEQKDAINEIQNEGYNLNPQDHFGPSKDEENVKDPADHKAADNGPSQDVDLDDGADEGKKLKDIKGVRSFKFALAEFVKELLKPSWKDGQVSKDAYKTIVKKVVDKVMETLGPQVPQTKEKIDMYLSYSKPKIDKLVQAYVGKHRKGLI